MTAQSSNPQPLEVIKFDPSLWFIRILRTDGQQEWTIMRRDAYLGAFETLQEAIAGAWVALMITKQGDTANMLWDWRENVASRRWAA